jgi:hypothetical protein
VACVLCVVRNETELGGVVICTVVICTVVICTVVILIVQFLVITRE